MKVRMTVEQPNREVFIERVIAKYHFSLENADTLLSVYDKVRSYMAPYAAYRINNHMRGVALIDDHPSAIVAMTLGEGVDRLQEYYDREHALEESYMVECIANELLLLMYAEFNRSYPKFHRRYVKRYVFVGDEIPLDSMCGLLEEIYGKPDKKSGNPAEGQEPMAQGLQSESQIIANAYGVLSPSKSVVFFAILSENPGTQCQGICMNCGNLECENRMQEKRQLQNRVEPPELASTMEEKQQLNYGYQRIFGQK